MATSQNGWPALTSYSDPALQPLTGFPGKVRRGHVHTIFEAFIDRFVERVEPIAPVQDDWAFAPRKIAGTSIVSNHASGTAIDLNAQRHPQFKTGTFTTAQVRELRSILDEFDGVITWGGDWANIGRADEMHFEISGRASAEDVARVAKKVTGAGPVTGVTDTVSPVWIVDGADRLNARSGPGLKHSVVGSVPRGTRLTGTGRVSNGWVEAASPWQLAHGVSAWYSSAEMSRA